MKICVIIGSGLGGLSAGVILAKNGYEVTILEQSHQIGGCLQCFWRDGVKFETGMHIVGSLDDGEILSNYFNYLEIKDKIQLQRLDTNAYDVVMLRDEKYSFPNGRDAFIEYFSQQFPSQRENLEHYFDLMEKVYLSLPFGNLHKENTTVFYDGDLFMKSINEVLDQTITDPKLRDILVGNITLYAGEKDKTPFSVHAFISKFYNDSTFRVVGGSDRIATALAEVLESYGGRVLTHSKVVKILVDNNLATGVMTEDGRVFSADIIVSDIHPKQLVTMVDDRVFTDKYVNRIKNIPDTTSVFSLYFRFKEDTMPYMNSNFYKLRKGLPWSLSGKVDDNWPQGFLYVHHCHQPNPRFAQGGTAFAYLSMDNMKPWENTTVGRRGKEYEEYKQMLAERLLDALEESFPGIRDTIASYYVATPLTYRDYTSTPNGSVYGLVRDLNLGLEGKVKYKTRVPNLFFTGQNIIAHGILGVLASTMIVARHLIGDEEIVHQMVEANRKKAVVIGGGLGGLMTGALLAKENYKVMVLEKNKTVGGGLQSFKRHGFSFPTGMHVFGGCQENGTLRKLFTYLGIMDKLVIRSMDKDANDVVALTDGSAEFRFPQGKKNYIDYLSSLFPEERDNIVAYVEKLIELSKEAPLFYLREGDYKKFDYSEDFLTPFDGLINRYFHTTRLKQLLHYLTPMFNGVDGQSPAYLNALTSTMHINGTSQFIGGSQQLADLLVGLIEEAGGSVLTGKKVSEIKVEDHKITKVVTQDGSIFKADSYISDVHPSVLLEIIDKNAFTKAYLNRLQNNEETISSFKVYVVFKERSFPYLNQTHLLVNDYDKCMDLKSLDPADWPHGCMFVTPPQKGQGHYASTMVINCLMNYEWVKPWENTTVGCRGEEYEKWKQLHLEKVIAMMKKVYPGFRDCIKTVFASSPLTIRDYLGNKEGSLYGFHRDCNNLLLSQLSVYTKVKNLFLTGQNINTHGLCGVALTAVETAEALVGYNAIVHKINETTRQDEKV